MPGASASWPSFELLRGPAAHVVHTPPGGLAFVDKARYTKRPFARTPPR
jgi:hypothetical protein